MFVRVSGSGRLGGVRGVLFDGGPSPLTDAGIFEVSPSQACDGGSCHCYRVPLWLPPLETSLGVVELLEAGGSSGAAKVSVTRFLWSREVSPPGSSDYPPPAIDPSGNVLVAGSPVGLRSIAADGKENWAHGGELLAPPMVLRTLGVPAVAVLRSPLASASPEVVMLATADGGSIAGLCSVSAAGKVHGGAVMVPTGGGEAAAWVTTSPLLVAGSSLTVQTRSQCDQGTSSFALTSNVIASAADLLFGSTRPGFEITRFTAADSVDSPVPPKHLVRWGNVLVATLEDTSLRRVLQAFALPFTALSTVASYPPLNASRDPTGPVIDAAGGVWTIDVLGDGGYHLVRNQLVVSDGGVAFATTFSTVAPRPIAQLMLAAGGVLLAITSGGEVRSLGQLLNNPLVPAADAGLSTLATLGCGPFAGKGAPGRFYRLIRDNPGGAVRLEAWSLDYNGLDRAAAWPRYQHDEWNRGNAEGGPSPCP